MSKSHCFIKKTLSMQCFFNNDINDFIECGEIKLKINLVFL